MPGSRFQQRSYWGFRSFACDAVWSVWRFLRSSNCKWWGVPEEHELTRFLRNAGKHQPSDRVSHRRRPESNNTYYSFGGCNKGPIRPCYMGSKELCPGVPQNSIRDARYPAFFSSYNNAKILSLSKTILILIVGENIYGTRQLPSSHWHDVTGEGQEGV